jgi:hypothetical protein
MTARTVNGRRRPGPAAAAPAISAAGEDWRTYWGIPPALSERRWMTTPVCGAGPVRCRLFQGHSGRHEPAPVADKFPAQREGRRRR